MVGVGLVVGWASRNPLKVGRRVTLAGEIPAIHPVVDRVDTWFRASWKEAGVQVAPSAEPLALLRRLSLALHGTIPSLEEIRQFEADDRPDRLLRWTRQALDDSRFSDYFAERLARGLVGTDKGSFIVYRRDRFVSWLADQLKVDRPYDQIVREMMTRRGLWTGKSAAVNFLMSAFKDDEFDEMKLAGRTVRSFLGQRMDCAQCHDHPFDDWTQAQFEGLSAFYSHAQVTIVGLEDKDKAYTIQDRKTLKDRVVVPAVPFGQSWLPATGTLRERLATWIVHPQNVRFPRAIVNRVWGYVFGRPYVVPVDDLPDPDAQGDLLDILADDFKSHQFSIKRLILVMTSLASFRLDSTPAPKVSHGRLAGGEGEGVVVPGDGRGTVSGDGKPGEVAPVSRRSYVASSKVWACFPLVRLRPEQVIGALLQSANIKTIDQNSHLIQRFVRFIWENDFLKLYGDLGDLELDGRGGTIPQRLLLLNGKFAKEASEAQPFSSAGRLAMFATTDRDCVDGVYLICLTRRPTLIERRVFEAQLSGATSGDERSRLVEDLFWSLLNSTEFAWGH